jgi:predicted acyltransferase
MATTPLLKPKTKAPLLKPNTRILSIDALRGFDMFFISGGGTFLVLLEGKTGMSFVDGIARQLTHPEWNGFTFYDFIFPLFLFIAGISLSFSMTSGLSKGNDKSTLYTKVFYRMLILIGLGILYKNAPVPFYEPSQIRFGSVLGRIGIASFFACLLYLNFNGKQRLLWVGGILLSYYAALFLIPVPGYGAGNLSFEGNLVAWVDQNFMPGRLHQKTYDELALLTQFPALCLTVLGTLAGDILRRQVSNREKLQKLLMYGVIGILLGLIWNLHFPINKHLWSSSFILLTGGMAFLSIALFYLLIDVWGYKKWAFVFQVIGINSLAIYLAYRFIDFRSTSHLFFEGLYHPLPEQWHNVFEALGAFILVWLFLYFLYRQKLFLKV